MNMISANHNYDNGYVCLVNLALADLPETVKINGYELFVKSEFHISLICVKRIAPIIGGVDRAELENEIVNFFLDFIKSTPLIDYSFDNVYRLVRKDERAALVGMVNVPGIEKLFAGLEKKFGVTLPLQPTHITLYTLQPDAGIGILSEEQLEEISEIIEVPIKL